jgi:hypothetical protein
MVEFLTKLLLVTRFRLKSRVILRQQVIVLSRKSPSRMRLQNIDRLIFVWLYRFFPSILTAITVVKPETMIPWYQRGFRAYWRSKSRCVVGARGSIVRRAFKRQFECPLQYSRRNHLGTGTQNLNYKYRMQVIQGARAAGHSGRDARSSSTSQGTRPNLRKAISHSKPK